MGSLFSKTSKNNDKKETKKRALVIYKYRIKNYDPSKHGPTTSYMRRINAEYELHCSQNIIY
jgi:hypothetical protein